MGRGQIAPLRSSIERLASFGHRKLFAKVRSCENVDEAALSYAENRLRQRFGDRHGDLCETPSPNLLKEIAVATSASEEQTVGTETAEAETVAIRYIFQSFTGMIMRMVYENRER